MAIANISNVFALASASFLLYSVALVVYRLYFHPLAKFPGSKIAAATLWYDYYYDVHKRGTQIWQTGKLHDQYGPIIRLSPNEIHIRDSEYYDEIYTSAPRKRDKWLWHTRMSSSPSSAFSTVPHDLHRVRRGVMNPFFSKRRVVELEPRIRSKIDKLAARFSAAAKDESVISLNVAFMALSTDLFSKYAWATDPCYLDESDFKYIWKQTVLGGFEGQAQSRQMPWMISLLTSLPRSLLQPLIPQVSFFLRWQDGVRANVSRIISEPSPTAAEKAQPKTMFHALRDADLPASEKTQARLVDEGVVVMGAASETVAHTLATTSFYLLDDSGKDVLARLRTEIETLMPSPSSRPSYRSLENLSYLSAVVAEGLRLAFGITGRLPRVAPNEDLVYTDVARGKTWLIPLGTPVSSTGYFVLTDPEIFPEPHFFRPERWLKEDGSRDFRLEKYLVCFGKGSRQCLGMNLAYAELFLTLPMLVWEVFGRFELFETTKERDVDFKHDFFTAVPDLRSKGIRVKAI